MYTLTHRCIYIYNYVIILVCVFLFMFIFAFSERNHLCLELLYPVTLRYEPCHEADVSRWAFPSNAD